MARQPRIPQTPSLGSKLEDVVAWLDRARNWLTFADEKLMRLPAALTATAEWNPPNVAFGASTSVDVRVPGARMGDPVDVGFSDQEAGVLFTGAVSAPDVVTAVLTNTSVAGSAFNLNAGTLTVIVWRVI